MNMGILNDMLGELIDAAFETGYYQGALEKNHDRWTAEEKADYNRLNRESIARRVEIRAKILEANNKVAK